MMKIIDNEGNNNKIIVEIKEAIVSMKQELGMISKEKKINFEKQLLKI